MKPYYLRGVKYFVVEPAPRVNSNRFKDVQKPASRKAWRVFYCPTKRNKMQ